MFNLKDLIAKAKTASDSEKAFAGVIAANVIDFAATAVLVRAAKKADVKTVVAAHIVSALANQVSGILQQVCVNAVNEEAEANLAQAREEIEDESNKLADIAKKHIG